MSTNPFLTPKVWASLYRLANQVNDGGDGWHLLPALHRARAAWQGVVHAPPKQRAAALKLYTEFQFGACSLLRRGYGSVAPCQCYAGDHAHPTDHAKDCPRWWPESGAAPEE